MCVCCWLPLLQNEEDDATFWSRLIREEDRPAEQQEILMPRAARLAAAAGAAAGTNNNSSLGPRSRSSTPLGALSDAEADAEPAAARGKAKKAKAGGKKKQHGGSSEPGPPVEGAVLRVDEWLLDVDETGRPLPKQVRSPGAGCWQLGCYFGEAEAMHMCVQCVDVVPGTEATVSACWQQEQAQ
jgi:hypothetical protein